MNFKNWGVLFWVSVIGFFFDLLCLFVFMNEPDGWWFWLGMVGFMVGAYCHRPR